jgi:hypothetical protein
MFKRTVLVILAAVLLIGTYLWFFGFQTLMVLETRYTYRNIPIASMVPFDLPGQPVSTAAGTKLSSFGYEFEVPWPDEDTPNVQRKVIDLFPFRSGMLVLVGHGSNRDMIETLTKEGKLKAEDVRSVFGDSDYEFLQAALNTTPASLHLTDSTPESVRKAMLLLLKTIIVPGDSGIFKVSTPQSHGFQYGDPGKHPRRVVLALYSQHGLVELTFSRRDGNAMQDFHQ